MPLSSEERKEVDEEMKLETEDANKQDGELFKRENKSDDNKDENSNNEAGELLKASEV